MILTTLLAASVSGAVVPGELDAELPTLHCLGYRWFVGGEKASEAKVNVAYRRRGEEEWKRAMDLFRVETAAMKNRPPAGFLLYAGSILGLDPGTDYEVRLALKHRAETVAERTLVQRTWTEPAAPPPLRVLHVVPGKGGGSGTGASPYRGLPAADAAARPGDLILVHPGTYEGPVTFSKSGSSEAPIVWRGTGDGEPVIQAPPDGRVISASGIEHVHFEKLGIKGGRWAMIVHRSRNLVVRRCRFFDVATGVSGSYCEERIFVSDCLFEGRQKWPGKAKSEDRAIELSGSAHVVCYNRIRGFKDAVDTRTPLPVTGVDIHNNDISECLDDGIELDFSEHNCRAYENRITNVNLAISFQPTYGGPAYAVRNVMYNVTHETFKLHITPPNTEQDTSGGVLLHNTVLKKGVPFRVWSNEGPARYFYSRNNLLVGAGGAPYAIEITCPMEHCDFDHDVFAGQFRRFANWNRQRYGSLSAFAAGTGLEAHGLVVKSIAGIFGPGVAPPEDPDTQYPVSANDLRLAHGSPAADRGVHLPNVNDGFAGAAPDAGAYELGRPVPHYGPRPEEGLVAVKSGAPAAAPGGSVWALVAKKLKKGARPEEELARLPGLSQARDLASGGDYEAAAERLERELVSAPEAADELRALAAGFRASIELRTWIIGGSARGRSESTSIDLMGVRLRGKVVAAEEEDLTVAALGSESRLAWNDLSPSRLFSLAKKYAREGAEIPVERAAVLELFARACGLKWRP